MVYRWGSCGGPVWVKSLGPFFIPSPSLSIHLSTASFVTRWKFDGRHVFEVWWHLLIQSLQSHQENPLLQKTEKLYNDNAMLRTRLTSVEKLSLTTDSWTTLITESYRTNTRHSTAWHFCHYLTGKYTVLFCRSKQRHSGILLKTWQMCFPLLLNTGD